MLLHISTKRLFAAATGPSNFVDRCIVVAVGGNGGDGLLTYKRHAKHSLLGPGLPWGGPGGRGGDVLLKAQDSTGNLATLKDHVNGNHGGEGRRKYKPGANGGVTVLKCPTGVRISEYKGFDIRDPSSQRSVEIEPVADLIGSGESYVLAHGGIGGLGNSMAEPHKIERGKSGEARKFLLELRSIADCGLVGLPNAGKSSFLRAVSRAKPKVASYPFTTLAPYIGSVKFPEVGVEGETKGFQHVSEMSIADVPGLVENAHKDEGLGHEFLRHLERTKMLIYVIDMNTDGKHGTTSGYVTSSAASLGEKTTSQHLGSKCVIKNLLILQDEVSRYSLEMALRPFLVLANKCDTGLTALENTEKLTKYLRNEWSLSHVVSGAMGGSGEFGEDFQSSSHNLHVMGSSQIQRKLEAMMAFKPSLYAISASKGMGCLRALGGMRRLLSEINGEIESEVTGLGGDQEFEKSHELNSQSRGFYQPGAYGKGGTVGTFM